MLYTASDGVLANSVAEPFGLVGLEAMAAGGVAFTGGTGEDYAVGGRNAIVLETLDPSEIVTRWKELTASPQLGAKLRRAARKTAREYTWRAVATMLIGSLTRHARRQGLLLVDDSPSKPTNVDVTRPAGPGANGSARPTPPAKWRRSRHADDSAMLTAS
jgi:hypothetical protein